MEMLDPRSFCAWTNAEQNWHIRGREASESLGSTEVLQEFG